MISRREGSSHRFRRRARDEAALDETLESGPRVGGRAIGVNREVSSEPCRDVLELPRHVERVPYACRGGIELHDGSGAVIQHDDRVVEAFGKRAGAAGEQLGHESSVVEVAGALYGHVVRSSWPFTRLRPAIAEHEGRTLIVCSDPDVIAAAEAELLVLPRQVLKDGRRCAGGDTSIGAAGWFEGVGSFVFDAGRRRVVAVPPRSGDAEWEHLVVGWALPSLLGELGATVLHGCVVAGRDRAWILCGPSGTGKTTTSLALRDAGMQVLADDVAVVEGGAREVAAGPRGSRVIGAGGTKALHFDDASPSPSVFAPLGGLAVLGPRGTGLQQRCLAPSEAFVALVPHACPASEAARRRMTHAIADLARGLPVLAISMPDDLNALPAAAAALAEVLA